MLKPASHSYPRVINVEKNPPIRRRVEQLKEEGTLHNRTQLRQCKYLNNREASVGRLDASKWMSNQCDYLVVSQFEFSGRSRFLSR